MCESILQINRWNDRIVEPEAIEISNLHAIYQLQIDSTVPEFFCIDAILGIIVVIQFAIISQIRHILRV